MPVVKVELVGKQDAAMKKELMEYIAEQISVVSNTPMQNIYVFINEWDAENVPRKDPIITLDWVAKPDRDAAVKNGVWYYPWYMVMFMKPNRVPRELKYEIDLSALQ